ncbi:MAG: hypothetical protein U1G07_13045 [Verrucomicrobiota bacterium]
MRTVLLRSRLPELLRSLPVVVVLIQWGALALPLTVKAADTAAKGPLRVSALHPRYFADPTGRAVYLTGSHTWASLQDMGPGNPPPRFDFAAYLDFLLAHHHNFIRLWRWEFPEWKEHDQRAPFSCTPQPWRRVGPGLALDGAPQYDLDQFDADYFGRLRSRVEAAGRRGIYVSIMLFEGWGLRFVPGGEKAHPFHPANNLNHTERDLKEGFKGIDLFTLGAPGILSRQEAYVRKVIDTVNDLDNVLYEIANESDFSTTDWQYHFIRFIRKDEASRPKQHLVGMTSIGYGVDDWDRLVRSPADWISPNPDRFDYKTNPPAADGTKVIILDTDHLWGVGDGVSWVWKSFLRGINPVWMDPMGQVSNWEATPTDAEQVRLNMGEALRMAERLDLGVMQPRPDLASTMYCLAKPGADYLVYQPIAGQEFTVQLEQGPYQVEWLSPATRKITRGELIEAAPVTQSFKAPFDGDAVLYLRRP